MPKGIYQHKPNQGFQKGHSSLVTEKSKKKIRLGLKKTYRIGKRIAWNKGKKCPLQRERMKGKKYNWKGGITPESKRIRNSIQFRLWREAVFARDNWTCSKCKKRGIKLNSHHIQNFAQYPELRFAIDNGITFCKKCHEKFHKRYGTKNNNEQQLEEFLYASYK